MFSTKEVIIVVKAAPLNNAGCLGQEHSLKGKLFNSVRKFFMRIIPLISY